MEVTNDSTKSGFLRSTAASVDVELVVRDHVSGITGLDKTMVRRAWLRKPGSTPPVEVDWCSIHLREVEEQGYRHKRVRDEGDKGKGAIEHTAWRRLTFLLTFYGANARDNAEAYVCGLTIAQNNALLRKNGMKFQYIANPVTRIPEFIGQEWRDRYDVLVSYGACVKRNFKVRNLASASVGIVTESADLNKTI